MSEIVDVLRLWLDGKPTTDVVVWGHSMLIWGRMGKMIQLVAGGAVVIDLLGPAWFQRRGAALQDDSKLFFRRSEERRAFRRIIRLREAVACQFLANRSFMTGPASAVVRILLVTAPPDRVPRGLGLTLDEYRDYHRQVVGQVLREHTCTDPDRSTCGKLQDYVGRRIDELVAAQLPPHQRRLIEDAKVVEIGGYGALIGSLIGLAVVAAGVATEDVRLLVPGALLVPLSWSWRVRLVLSALSHRVLGGLQRAVGRDLGKPQLLVALRWTAFTFLIFGTLLDLLAS
ncbi:hypothetical protein O7602_14195 [Micromonospora sp. WMMD1128]|uniref:hypothetical protein n=1 Tax=Micromonospora sp. WMMD1128 TaxID=3015150 RepID=UPI00248BA59A|nr:hypothetical protein [Micromonospora sp. WMMD1128]WBB76606.1 hypothetical protein O7602_14195 [Micromonospora sp. WMMD1128]